MEMILIRSTLHKTPSLSICREETCSTINILISSWQTTMQTSTDRKATNPKKSRNKRKSPEQTVHLVSSSSLHCLSNPESPVFFLVQLNLPWVSNSKLPQRPFHFQILAFHHESHIGRHCNRLLPNSRLLTHHSHSHYPNPRNRNPRCTKATRIPKKRVTQATSQPKQLVQNTTIQSTKNVSNLVRIVTWTVSKRQ